jgi:transmembrane sensor
MKEARSIDEIAADWVAAKDSERWSPALQAQLEAWLAQSIQNRVAFLRLESGWRRADRLGALRLNNSEYIKPSLGLGWRRGGVAALAATVLIAIALSSQSLRFAVDRGNVYTTDIGQRKAVLLNDGTQVTLNTSSSLRISITGDQRQSWLDHGEAFFDVAHDPAREFVVHVGNRHVHVLGTKFSLRHDGEKLQVNVLEGTIRVEQRGAAPLVLTKTDAAIISDSAAAVLKQSAEKTFARLSWLQGKLVFDGAPLADVAEQFNRYNRRQIVITDTKAAELRIGGTFEADNVDAFLHLLRDGFGLTIQESGIETYVASAAR